jgi:hypothetical protein
VSHTSKSMTVLRARRSSSIHQSKEENDNKEVVRIRICVGESNYPDLGNKKKVLLLILQVNHSCRKACLNVSWIISILESDPFLSGVIPQSRVVLSPYHLTVVT